jgi:hypothetical protein
MWRLVGKGFKPWEIEADYGPDERIIKPEDKADLFKLDQFEYNANIKRQKDQANKQVMKSKGKGYI